MHQFIFRQSIDTSHSQRDVEVPFSHAMTADTTWLILDGSAMRSARAGGNSRYLQCQLINRTEHRHFRFLMRSQACDPEKDAGLLSEDSRSPALQSFDSDG